MNKILNIPVASFAYSTYLVKICANVKMCTKQIETKMDGEDVIVIGRLKVLFYYLAYVRKYMGAILHFCYINCM